MKLLNVTAHEMNEDQIKELKKMGVLEVTNLKDISSDTFQKLINADEAVFVTAHLLYSVIANTDYDYYHLPISSPAVNFIFSRMIPLRTLRRKTLIFSHTAREVVEEKKKDKTVKKSIFKFKSFINVSALITATE